MIPPGNLGVGEGEESSLVFRYRYGNKVFIGFLDYGGPTS
jgi:hypothetical protein